MESQTEQVWGLYRDPLLSTTQYSRKRRLNLSFFNIKAKHTLCVFSLYIFTHAQTI